MPRARLVLSEVNAYADFVRPRWQVGESAVDISNAFRDWVAKMAESDGCDPDAVHRYEVVVPSYMQAPGLMRYMQKFEAES